MSGNPQILTCPFCGKEKEIMSLVSGNTFGSELWSDNKQIAPMLPEISYVQKCPHCGKYFIKGRQAVKYAKDGYCFEKGLLTFPETKEAFAQLAKEGFIDEKEEINVRMMLHHAYNDYYYRNIDKKDILNILLKNIKQTKKRQKKLIIHTFSQYEYLKPIKFYKEEYNYIL